MSDVNDLIEIIKKNKNLNNIFEDKDLYSKIEKTCSFEGFIYEKIFDILIKFKCCEKISNQYTCMKGNVNNVQLTELKTLKYFLKEKIISGNADGYSDVTIKDYNNKYIFFSCKYFKKEEKNIDKYDIQKIVTMANANNSIYKDFDIYIVCKNKKELLKKSKQSNKSSNCISKYIKDDKIIDENDINKYLLKFNDLISKYDKKQWDNVFLGKKEILNLRFHQELICNKTYNLIIKKKQNSILWGCKCRSGKTYMFGGLIMKFNKNKKCNVLIITPAPTETITQFTDDLFDKFIDFNEYNIHNIRGSQELKKMDLSSNKNIIITSKQLLQKYVNENMISVIKDIDLICFDENHFSGTTLLSQDIINTYSSSKTNKIFLTATYNKPLKCWGISEECQLYWDIEDEQICKSILKDEKNIEKLIYKYDDTVTKTLELYKNKGFDIRSIFDIYSKMPDLHLMTTMFDNERYQEIKENIKDTKYGFSFDTLFALTENKENFKFEKEVSKILRYISGSSKEIDFKEGDMSIYSRINRICSEKDSRKPFTQIWFLPSKHINQISESLKKIILKDKILNNYNVLCINRNNEELVTNVKNDIFKEEEKTKAEGKDGLILFAGDMLTLGITLENCDLVLLFNNSMSSDKVMQQMYRSMTEANNKKFGFVIDLNISRVLNTCINYSVYKENKTLDEKLKYQIDNHLINIDVDIIESKKINSDKIVSKLINIWKSDPVNHFKSLLENLKNDIIQFDKPIQDKINDLFINSIQEKTTNVQVTLKDEEDDVQNLPDGKEIIKTDSDKDSSDSSSEDELTKKTLRNINFQKDILPYIVPLSCILTFKNNNYDFINILDYIKENNDLLEIFNDMSKVWWNIDCKKQTYLVDFIKSIIDENFPKNSHCYNIIIQMKLQLKSLIDKPNELLNLINECLKPKDIEKKENGEVFTPIFLIKELLDELDIYYKKINNGKSIFSEKYLKWLDPASGMGNFPIEVYLRLMNGLKEEIPNIKDRKKHILEEMLYMCELTKKNVMICRQIFDINNEYDLNLYQGDTLLFEPEKIFNVDRFDIILGNPPYNKGGIWSHTKKMNSAKREVIWMEFIKKSFKWLKPNGFLVFINPLYWLKSNNELHNIMLEKNIIWMKLWDNIKSLSVINGKIPISLFILENKINKENLKTKIISEIQSKKLKTESNVYLNKEYSIPLAYHNIFEKLIRFIEEKNLKLEYNTKTVKSIGNKKKLPNNYELKDNWAVDTYTIKDGIMVKKTNEEHPDRNKRKLIIANKASFTGVFIDNCKLSLTGCNKYYILGDGLEIILKMLNFKIIDIISHFTKYTQDFLDKEAFKYIPDIRKLGIVDITEEEFYELIGFNDEEIKLFGKHSIKDNSKYLKKLSQDNGSKIQDNIKNEKLSEEELSKKKVKELKKLCKDNGLKNYSKLKKNELIKKYLDEVKESEPKKEHSKKKPDSKKKTDSNEVLSDEELTSQHAIADSLNASSDDELTDDSDTDEEDLYTEADLNLMTVPKIKQALNDKNIPFRSRDRKAILIQKYLDAV